MSERRENRPPNNPHAESTRPAEITDLIARITQGTRDMIAAEDMNFRYTYFNDAYQAEFKRLWGRELQIGDSMVEFMAPWPEEQHKAIELWRRAMEGESYNVMREFGPTESQTMVYELQFNPLKDAQGRTIGAAHIIRNVTDQVRFQQALKESEERLRDAERRKDEYLAMLGHELRNPLAAVRGATELIQRSKPDDPRLQRAADVLERQSLHMASLIDGLLEVSRIARGKIELRHEVLDLRQVLRDVAADRAAEFEERRLELRTHFPEAPLWVTGDRVRLAQVFGNLLGNALKFTPAPGTISMELEEREGLAVTRVCDTGVGVRPQMLTRIFEPFHQESQDTARASGGLGLGLSLAAGLVELHNGAIQARSAGTGTGAEFEVRLPTAPAPQAAQADKPSDAQGFRKVLIVEDNDDIADTLCELLQMKGHDVRKAAHGAAALERLREAAVDVVLCDIGLPGMDGYEIARAIRNDPAMRGTVLAALTGYGQAEDRRRSREAGFDHHLVKPVAIKTLERLLADPHADPHAQPSANARAD